jgi:hypothetical protein
VLVQLDLCLALGADSDLERARDLTQTAAATTAEYGCRGLTKRAAALLAEPLSKRARRGVALARRRPNPSRTRPNNAHRTLRYGYPSCAV